MSTFETVKDRIDLASYIGQYAPLKRAGSLMVACCPLPGHADKTPSFQVKGDHWVCRGKCGVGGDVFDFAMAYHGWSKQEALVELARYAGVTLEPLSPEHKAKQDSRARLYALMEHAAQFYTARLYENDAALDYLIDVRKLTMHAVNEARLGYAPIEGQRLRSFLKSCGYSDEEMLAAKVVKRNDKDQIYDAQRNRIVIPVRDMKWRIVAFTGRGQSQTPKYLHTETSEIFQKSSLIHRMPQFDAERGKGAFSSIIVVEGSLDPISASQNGFNNVVSQMGTSLSDEQLTLLCQPGIETIIFCLDNDAAGHAALKRLVQKHMHAAAEKGIDLYTMTVPHGKDPDDTFRERPDLWPAAVDAARPVTDVLLDRERAALPTNPTPAQKQVWGLKMLPLLKGANGFVNEDNLKKLSAALGSSLDTIEGWTRSQVALMPTKNTHVQKIDTALPSLELIVLHGLLVNEDPQRWLDRANATLSLMPFPKACAPLSLNDFTSKPCRDLMAVITTAAAEERPFDGEVQTQIGTGPLSEVYWRAVCAPEVQAIFATHDARPAFQLTYGAFMTAVYRLRHVRLDTDITRKLVPDADLAEWVRAKLYLWTLITAKGGAS